MIEELINLMEQGLLYRANDLKPCLIFFSTGSLSHFHGLITASSRVSAALRNFYYSDQHKHFMYLRIFSLWTWWDPNMHSIYGLSCQKAWRWPVRRSKHVACNKTTIKSVVPDIPLFYFISINLPVLFVIRNKWHVYSRHLLLNWIIRDGSFIMYTR
jgi:hypothetical protein